MANNNVPVPGRLLSDAYSEDPAYNQIVAAASGVYDDQAPYSINGHVQCTIVTPVAGDSPVELRWYERVNYGTEQQPQYEWLRSEDTIVDNQKTYGTPNGAKQSDINYQLYQTINDVNGVVLYATGYEAVTPQPTDNPQANGWYELSGSTYVLTTDITVVSGKTYYARQALISPDADNITNQRDGYVPTAGAVGRALGANFEDNLTSTSTVKGLTANMGRVLNEKKADKNGWYEQFVAGASLSVIGDDTDDKAKFFYRETGDSEDTGGTKHTIEKGTATIDTIYGNTVKWNQIVLNGDFSNGTTGWYLIGSTTTSASNNECVVNMGVRFDEFRKSISLVNNHKYFIRADIKGSEAGKELGFGLGAGNTMSSAGVYLSCNLTTSYQTYSYVGELTNKGNDSSVIFKLMVANIAPIAFTVKNVITIDLTQIFGAGNEPTNTTEVEQWLALNVGEQDYYPYNTGSLISLKPKKLISTGFNRWGEEWRIGLYNNTTGEYQTASYATSYICNTNPIKVLPDKDYYIKTNKQAWAGAYADGVYLGPITTTNNILHTPDNCEFINFYLVNYGTAYNHDICINLSDPTKNGTYMPYMKSEVDLSWIKDIPDPSDSSKKLFPYGLLSVGNVYDEVKKDRAIKRVGTVDFGNVVWSNDGDYKYAPNDELKNFNSKQYVCIYEYSATKDARYKVLYKSGSGLLEIYAPNLTRQETQEMVSGVMFYYLLDTPVEVTFEEPDTHPMNYEVEPGGTEEFVKADAALGEIEPTSTSLTATVTYPMDTLQTIRNLETNLATLKSNYRTTIGNLASTLSTALGGTFTATESTEGSGLYTFSYTAPANTQSVEEPTETI